MVKTIDPGYIDTPISGVTDLSLDLPVVNFEEDYRVFSNTPGEVILTNVMSPEEQPATFRFASRVNKNVYAGTDISPAFQLPSKLGTDLLVSAREVLAIRDEDDPSLLNYAPVQVSITIMAPNASVIGPNYLQGLIGRAVAATCEQGVDNEEGLSALRHGVLTKKDM